MKGEKTMSNLDANTLNELIQRFAISVLSRERKSEAINEEILAGKYSGEFYIKTKDGVVLSADILNRAKSATDNAVRIAELVGMTGNIYKIDFDDLVLPNHVDYSVNILGNEPITLPDNVKEILINLDLDEYDIVENGEFKIVNSDAKVKITLVGGGKTEVVEKSLRNINFSILDISGFTKVKNVNIQSISIERSSDVINPDAIDRTVLVHNIFVTVNQ
jgi:hypothetical protein